MNEIMIKSSTGFFQTLLGKWAKVPKRDTKRGSRWVRPSLLPLEERMVLDTGFAGGSLPIDNYQPWLAVNYLMPLNGVYPNREDNWQEYAGNFGSPVLGEIDLFAGNFAPSGYVLAQGQILTISQYTTLFSLLGTTYGGDGINTFALPNFQGSTAMGVGQGAGLSPSFSGQTAGSPEIDLYLDSLPVHIHELLTAAGIPSGVTGSTGSSIPFSNQMPTLAVNFQMVVDSTFEYIGEVALTAGFAFPSPAQGQVLSINGNEPLFSQIGTNFGGDGVNTFALPDFQGRVPVGSGNGFALGQEGGSESITLTTTDLTAHTHLQLDTNTQTGSTGGGQSYNNLSPYNTVTYAIATEGFFPSREGSYTGPVPFVGQIKLFAQQNQNNWPPNWLPCDGRLLNISQNQTLYEIIGNNYGGDGVTTFALPDLRGRVPVGAGTTSWGQTISVGQTGGTQNISLSTAQMAIHSHSTPAIVSITPPASGASESTAPATRSAVKTKSSTAGNQLVYTITRDTTQSGGIVRLAISGTAAPSDHSLQVGAGATLTVVNSDTIEISFAPDALEVTLTARVIQDRLPEGKETLTFTLVEGEDYNLHFSLNVATGTIKDAEYLVTAGDAATGTWFKGPHAEAVTPYPGFHGEIRVIQADVTGDGIPEIITAPGRGIQPLVKVFNAETGKAIYSFLAFEKGFLGGVSIAVGDVNGNGAMDIITGAGNGGGPRVVVFDGLTRTITSSFYAFDPRFRGGVSVAAFNMQGDAAFEIVVAAGPGAGPAVAVFNGANHAVIKAFYAFAPNFRGGVTVAAGEIGLDGRAKIVTAAGLGGGSQVKVWDYQTLTVDHSFNAYSYATLVNGVLLNLLHQGAVGGSIYDVDGDGINDLVTTAGSVARPHIKAYSGAGYLTKMLQVEGRRDGARVVGPIPLPSWISPYTVNRSVFIVGNSDG